LERQEESESKFSWPEWAPIKHITDEELSLHRKRVERMDAMVKELHEYEQQKQDSTPGAASDSTSP
jgi:hypothetical protein